MNAVSGTAIGKLHPMRGGELSKGAGGHWVAYHPPERGVFATPAVGGSGSSFDTESCRNNSVVCIVIVM